MVVLRVLDEKKTGIERLLYLEMCLSIWKCVGKCVSKTKNQDSRLEIYTEREVAMLTLFIID